MIACEKHSRQMKISLMGIKVFIMAKSVPNRRPYQVYSGDRLSCGAYEPCTVVFTSPMPFFEHFHKGEPPLFTPHHDIMVEET